MEEGDCLRLTDISFDDAGPQSFDGLASSSRAADAGAIAGPDGFLLWLLVSMLHLFWSALSALGHFLRILILLNRPLINSFVLIKIS